MAELSTWQMSFHEAFNEAFRSHLNGVPMPVFMNVLLSRIVAVTGSRAGMIASFRESLEIEALEGLDEGDDDVDALAIDSVRENRIIRVGQRVGIPSRSSLDGSPIGVVVLEGVPDSDVVGTLDTLGTLIGVLQTSHLRVRSCRPVETDLLPQLFEHVLNNIRDGTIVVTNTFNIVYINHHAVNMIDTILRAPHNDVDLCVESVPVSGPEPVEPASPAESVPEPSESDPQWYQLRYHSLLDRNILDILPQLNVLSNGNNSGKLFKNRRIVARIENKRALMCPYVMEFIVNSVLCHERIYHLIMIYNNTDNVAYEEKNQTNFVAYLSHELRNPLQSINFANHLLNIQLTQAKVTDGVDSYLATITRSCHEMKKIINDILDLNKIEAREFIIELDVCNIRDLATNIVDEFRPSASDKGLTLDLCLGDDVPKTIFTDEVRLSQILSNLVSNAIKYSKSGEVKLDVQYENHSHGISFSVKDHGEGVRREEVPNLFTQHCQTSCSNKFTSNGLGLCVSQKIAHLLGGYISVVSEYRKGSTFTLFHPIKLENSGLIRERFDTGGDLRGKILVVDDNESNLSLLRLMLDHFNCEYKYSLETQGVRDGKDAIDVTRINTYDLIFMDVNMPGIDGCTASKLIKLNGFAGKIVATTGNILAKRENVSLCKEYEKYKYFDDVIIKPYDDSTILKMLRRHLSPLSPLSPLPPIKG